MFWTMDVKKKIVKSISGEHLSTEEIIYFASLKLFQGAFLLSDMKTIFVAGIVFSEDGLYYSENGQRAMTSMSYSNMKEVKDVGLYILIKGKTGTKMWIKKHPIMIDTDEFIDLINTIIDIV